MVFEVCVRESGQQYAAVGRQIASNDKMRNEEEREKDWGRVESESEKGEEEIGVEACKWESMTYLRNTLRHCRQRRWQKRGGHRASLRGTDTQMMHMHTRSDMRWSSCFVEELWLTKRPTNLDTHAICSCLLLLPLEGYKVWERMLNIEEALGASPEIARVAALQIRCRLFARSLSLSHFSIVSPKE